MCVINFSHYVLVGCCSVNTKFYLFFCLCLFLLLTAVQNVSVCNDQCHAEMHTFMGTAHKQNYVAVCDLSGCL